MLQADAVVDTGCPCSVTDGMDDRTFARMSAVL